LLIIIKNVLFFLLSSARLYVLLCHHFQSWSYIHYIDKDSKMTGPTWSTAFLVELWNLPWEMWEHHNGILHGATNTPQQQRSVEELLLEVNAELEQGPDTLLVPDQQLMDRDPNTF
jgi:hypothetical protein